MLTRLDLRGVADLRSALTPPPEEPGPVAAVREILQAVRERGDAAVREFTQRFDGVALDDLRVDPADVAAAWEQAPAGLQDAIDGAYEAIRHYHEVQAASSEDLVVESPGIRIDERAIPVDRAGLYAPGGRAVYPSTVLMTAIPARVAGVGEVALCVPPGADGRVPAATLAAAARAGVDEVYRVGGAQAIAALAYGTESIPAVDVIVGPGNAYVALAKREVAGLVGIEGFAGPSEVVVVADASANARWVAVDLLAQAEHGPGGTAVLVTWDATVADAVDAALAVLLADAPRRADIEATLASGGQTLLVDGPDAALAAVDAIAPEHVEVVVDGAAEFATRIRNAGAIFVGAYAPAAAGDYAVGVNHVLPTARTARFASALRVEHFRKHVHVVTIEREGLARLAPHVVTLASVEGLAEHARSITVRESVS